MSYEENPGHLSEENENKRRVSVILEISKGFASLRRFNIYQDIFPWIFIIIIFFK